MILSNGGDEKEKPATSNIKAKKRPSGMPYTADAHITTFPAKEGLPNNFYIDSIDSIQLTLFARSWLITFL